MKKRHAREAPNRNPRLWRIGTGRTTPAPGPSWPTGQIHAHPGGFLQRHTQVVRASFERDDDVAVAPAKLQRRPLGGDTRATGQGDIQDLRAKRPRPGGRKGVDPGADGQAP